MRCVGSSARGAYGAPIHLRRDSTGYHGCWCTAAHAPAPGTGRHMCLHFVESNHWIAAHRTRGELFCFKCGDFVYDETFGQIRRASYPCKRPSPSWDGRAWRTEFFCSPAVSVARKRPRLSTRAAHGGALAPAALQDWVSRCAARRKMPTRMNEASQVYCRRRARSGIHDARDGASRACLVRGRPLDAIDQPRASQGTQSAGLGLAQHGLRGFYNMGSTCFMNCILQVSAAYLHAGRARPTAHLGRCSCTIRSCSSSSSTTGITRATAANDWTTSVR